MATLPQYAPPTRRDIPRVLFDYHRWCLRLYQSPAAPYGEGVEMLPRRLRGARIPDHCGCDHGNAAADMASVSNPAPWEDRLSTPVSWTPYRPLAEQRRTKPRPWQDGNPRRLP